MIHVIIQTERRKAQRELAINIQSQLHSMGASITDPTNILYAAEWDGKAPYVIVTKGSIADIKMAYAGWPMVTKEQWTASQPKAP